MADLNALIAQGVDFKAPPDPFAQYGQMQQLEQGRQANQLNQMKMQEYTRGVQEQEQLRQLDPSAQDYLSQVTRINPKLGFEFGKLQREGKTAELAQQKTTVDVAKAKREFVQQAQRDTSRNPSDANITAFKEDLMASDMFTAAEKAQMAAGADQILAMPIGERQAFMASQGASAGELKPTLTPQNLGNTSQILSTPAFGGQAGVVPGSVQQNTITPGQAQANRLAEARLDLSERRLTGVESRAAAGPKAPDLKLVPVHAQKAIVGASTAIKKLDDAIAQLEASPAADAAAKAKAAAGKDATGLKGYLPDIVLNRLYPAGTEARAAVGDIGSLIIHERSGAAVTAAEAPRLRPFIPLITDSKEVALKKLKRMRQIQADEAEALAGTYTPDQGFREFTTPAPGGKASVPVPTASAGGLSPAEQAELDALRKRFKK